MHTENLYVETYGIPALESINEELCDLYARESAMILGFDVVTFAMEADGEGEEPKVGKVEKLKTIIGNMKDAVEALPGKIDKAITEFMAKHKYIYAIAYTVDGAIAKVGTTVSELRKTIAEAAAAVKEGATERVKDAAVNIRHAHDELNSWKESFQAACVNKMAKSGMKAMPGGEEKVAARLRSLRKVGLGEGNKIVNVSESMMRMCANIKDAGMITALATVFTQAISLFVAAITAPISIAAYVVKGIATDRKIAHGTKPAKAEAEEA